MHWLNLILRAFGILVPVSVAIYAPQIVAKQSSAWCAYPWIFGAALVWFVFIRGGIFYALLPYHRRDKWRHEVDEAAPALIKDILDFAESKNDATRALVVAFLALWITYQLTARHYAELQGGGSSEVPFEVIFLSGVLGVALAWAAFWLQTVINLGKRVIDPLYLLIVAANAEEHVVGTIHQNVKEKGEEKDKFDQFRGKWRQHYISSAPHPAVLMDALNRSGAEDRTI